MSFNGLRFARVLAATVLLILLPYVVLAQEDDRLNINTQLLFDQTSLAVGETGIAILTLRNATPYTLTNITAQLQGTTFDLIQATPLPDTVSPFSAVQAESTLQSQTAGSQNLIFTVQYSWYNPDSGITHQGLETVSVEKIEVRPWLSFDWPDYLIPLIIGLITGQLITLWNDRRKQRQESQQQEEQARGITLAVLQAARKGLQEQKPVSFALWEEAVVKGNLYPALHQLGRTIGKPELSKRLAELSITLAEYNQRLENHSLPDGFTTKLVDELDNLVQIIESKR
jgi:hypothetical protein